VAFGELRARRSGDRPGKEGVYVQGIKPLQHGLGRRFSRGMIYIDLVRRGERFRPLEARRVLMPVE